MPVDCGAGLVLPAATRAMVYRSEQAWKRHRRKRITGTDPARILGLSPYGSAWDVWNDKHGVRQTYSPTKLALFARGRREESRTLEDYAEATRDRVVGPLGMMMVDGPDLTSATPDSFLLARPGAVGRDGWGLGEAKSSREAWDWGPSGFVIDRWTPDAAEVVSEDYAAQVYLQLAATGLKWARLIVKIGMDDLRWYTIHADPVIQREIVQRCRSWFERCILGNETPSVDSSAACWRAQQRLWPPKEEKFIRDATAEEIALALELHRMNREKREVLPLVRNQLSDAMANADRVEWPSHNPRRPHRAQRQRTQGGGSTIRIYLTKETT